MGSQTPMQEISKNPSLLLLLLLAASSFLHTTTAYSRGYMQFTKDATLFPAESEYDYIIVGGGTVGCPLAATLSGGGRCVLLLERGGAPDECPSPATSSGFLATLATTNQDSPAQPFASEEGVANTRARVLGGRSSINAGFYSRAHPEFYTVTASSRGYMRFTKDATLFPAELEYDYIIVGGGAVGCPLAATLSGGGRRVLLLERGGAPDDCPSLATSSGFLATLATTNQDSPAQPFALEEGVANTRARVLCGGSSINAGFYSRAHPEFYTANASSRGCMRLTKDAMLFPTKSEYDYIIVGGGAAGCPLVATLSGGGRRVLLLERGGAPDECPSPATSSGFLATLATTNQDSPAQPFASEEGVANTRARVLGGGSSINVGFYSRVHPEFCTEVPSNWDTHSVNRSYEWIERALVHRPEVRGGWQAVLQDGLMEAGVGPFFNGCTVEQKTGMKVGGAIFDAAGRRHLLSNAKPDRIRVATRATVDQIFLNQAQPGDFVILGATQYLPRRMLRDKPTKIDSGVAPASPVPRKSTWASYRWISHIGFIFSCSYNLLSWYLIVRYPTHEVQQSWWNLGALLVGALATLLITQDHAVWMRGWNATKEVLNAATTLLGVYGEAAVYRNHHHDKVGFVFLFLEILGFARCMSLGKGDLEKAVLVIRMIQLVGGLISSVVQFIGFAAHPDWEFITYEAYAAILGGFYSLCDISETDGQSDQIALLLLTAVIRFFYAFGIMWRSHRQGIATWGVRECYRELVNFRSRYVRSFRDCYSDMWAMTVTWGGRFRQLCDSCVDLCCACKNCWRVLCFGGREE